MSQTNQSEKKSPVNKIILGVAIALITIALLTMIVIQQRQLNSSGVPSADTSKIQARVAKLMLLPEEEAVITQIDDAEEVKAQPFFSQVENGDQVLIFPQAAKIVIFRPSQKILVNVGPIIDDRPLNSNEPAPNVETSGATDSLPTQNASNSTLINVN